ncbi:HD-GYP domain-containing protein [Leptothrix sp. BB-4]
MALIAFPARHLALNQPLPFRLFDGRGLLLAPAGLSIELESRLQALRSMPLFVDESEAGSWLRLADETAESLVLRNAKLQDISIARCRPGNRSSGSSSADRGSPSSTFDIGLSERWESLMRQINGALQEATPDGDWVLRLHAAMSQSLALTDRKPNELLFLLIQHAGHEHRQYSAHHAALCATVCARVAATLGWSTDDRETLTIAAMTMNVAMTALQDTLARQKDPVTPEQRQRIDQHALRSAALLAESGVTDPRWLKVVRLHHDASLLTVPLASLDPAQRMARLLNVVDRFTAKISRRAGRPPMSPLAAARAACVGPDGQPDEYGSALLRTLGMYPPGSYVRLVGGEIAVVMARGERANEPRVAVLVGSSGLPLPEPVLRDTASASRKVVAAVAVDEVRVRLNHEALIELL